MDTFKICISWVISSFYQSLKTSLHQCTYTTAENGLFTEKVCLSLCSECCLQNTCSCSTDCQCISQCNLQSFACSILMNSYQTRNTLARLIFASYCVSRSFRCDHGNIYICRWYDTSEVNIETVSEHQHVALFQVRFDIFFVKSCLLLIVDQDHDDISFLCSFCCCINFKSLCLCFCPGLAAFIKTDNNMASGFLCI